MGLGPGGHGGKKAVSQVTSLWSEGSSSSSLGKVCALADKDVGTIHFLKAGVKAKKS